MRGNRINDGEFNSRVDGQESASLPTLDVWLEDLVEFYWRVIVGSSVRFGESIKALAD